MVLSSAKLCRSDFFSYKNLSLTNVLNTIRPSIEPCGLLDRIISKRLEMLLTDTFCFRSSKQVKEKVNVSNPKPGPCSFAIRRSCGMQSNAFDRTIRKAPVKRLLTNAFLQFAMSSVQT